MDDTQKKPASFDPPRFRMGAAPSVDQETRKVLTAVPMGIVGWRESDLEAWLSSNKEGGSDV